VGGNVSVDNEMFVVVTSSILKLIISVFLIESYDLLKVFGWKNYAGCVLYAKIFLVGGNVSVDNEMLVVTPILKLVVSVFLTKKYDLLKVVESKNPKIIILINN
jgi:hypothetical protein